MYKCLWASLTRKAHNKLMLRTNTFTMLGQRLGIFLLKTIILDARIYSNAVAAMARLALSSVRENMGTIRNQDIITLKNNVQSHTKTLDSKGEISTDLIVHLFKGYAQANNKDIVAYMKDRETE